MQALTIFTEFKLESYSRALFVLNTSECIKSYFELEPSFCYRMMLGFGRHHNNETASLINSPLSKPALSKIPITRLQQPEATAQNIPFLPPSKHQYEVGDVEILQYRRLEALPILHQCQVEQVQINLKPTAAFLFCRRVGQTLCRFMLSAILKVFHKL